MLGLIVVLPQFKFGVFRSHLRPPKSPSPHGFAAALIATASWSSRNYIPRAVQRGQSASRAVSATAAFVAPSNGNGHFGSSNFSLVLMNGRAPFNRALTWPTEAKTQ
jgi:hypothetical protein